MDMNHHTKLTSSEIAMLWSAYMNDSLGKCTISYLLSCVEDKKIQEVLNYALDLSDDHIQRLKGIFNEEEHPIPMGFKENDVNLKASRLFSDNFMLYYISNMGTMGLNTYSVSVSNSSRQDIRDFFTACLHSSAELTNRARQVMQEKGIYIRPPYIPYAENVEFVHKQRFLAGWLGKQRPITSIELSYLFFNLQRNALGISLLTGFSQAASTKEIRQYMSRGAKIAKQHCEVLSKFLSDEDILTPMTWDILPTRSTDSPFSDKLMMFHTAALNAAGIGFYGTSMGVSPRRDLAAAYGRLTAEVGQFAEDGSNLMIDNGWLEKPPSVPDRKVLAET